ncbi:helicase [Amycolatopsis antarctica]|uniref:Helicase n=1 Tax=Amycolatopsis antarctica TaxID=1854586 RepID=A0A263D1N5_9PSEU|nr:ATP-binding domain-containing protein [Amycolatopsis antarctica]OZM72360.1 helicase [Amycolatopsis antarctica]
MSVSPQHRESEGDTEVAAEQRYLTVLYRHLDAERELATRRLHETLSQTGGTPQARTERDVATTTFSDRLAQLNSVEQGLCFGRLDFHDDPAGEETAYIGRLGLFDTEDDYRPLLVDWRAPVARPFYLATAASPDGVRRRRHIRSLSRRVTAVDDEILDLREADQGQDLGLAGEAALLAALERRRTGEMSDIVATIQAEQDGIIRASLPGVLVVQGGPGTGKTAVALHRAAYLLYTHRRQLTTRGVLVVGPNDTFLRYIGQVLPSLGETGVLLATVGELYPGVRANGLELPRPAEVKGRIAMVEVLADAVRDRQRVPEPVVEIEVEREILRLDRKTCTEARTRARRSRRPHNQARRLFVDDVLDALTRQTARRLGEDLLDPRDLDDIRAELAADENVAAALHELWPLIGPERLLGELLSDESLLRTAAGVRFTEPELAGLLRDPRAPFTPADVPLLDELAELLGEDDTESRAEAVRREREERAYAEGVLDVMEQDEEIIDEEVLRVGDVLDAELLAERQQRRSDLTAAQRAARDRTWTFGHVIVDEAQELSEMDWRLLMRRCPSRSMTLVGDVAQTGAEGGASSWAGALGPYVADRWRLRELTVNYRTPAEIMELAGQALAEVDPALDAPTSVRSTGLAPVQRDLAMAALPTVLREVAAAEVGAVGGGTVAVVCPQGMCRELRGTLADATTRSEAGEPNPAVLDVAGVKGLEFDSVVLVAPGEIVDGSPRGWNDLYVALTRATQRLTVLHTGPRPPALSGPGDRPGQDGSAAASR